MRALHLNLSARPYRNDRPYYAGVAAAILVIGFLLIKNVETAIDYFSSTSTTREEITALDRDIAAEQQKAAALDTQIKSLDLKRLNRRVEFVNTEIAARAFSWSQLLDVLERVVPKDVRIRSLTPSISKEGVTHLVITCESKTQGGLISLLNQMMADPHFARPFPNNQSALEGGLNQFAVEVDYKPEATGIQEISE